MRKTTFLGMLLIACLCWQGHAQTVFIDDDFDSYTAGPMGSQAAWWSTWSGNTGGTEDIEVTTLQANSGTQSGLIAEGGAQDALLLLGNKTSGVYEISWNMYVPTGKTGYWNIQGSETPGTFNGEFYIGASSSGGTAGVITHTESGTTIPYTSDTWFSVAMTVDLNNYVLSIEIDSVHFLTEPYPGTQLGALDFFSNGATNRYFIDDVLYEEASCTAPMDIVNSESTATTANVSWTATGTATNWEIEYGSPGFVLGSGTSVVDTDGTAGTTLTGLAPSLTYDLYIRTNCDGESTSAWAGPFSFATACGAITSIPYTENFDSYGTGSDAFPNCWSRPVINSGYPSIVSHGTSNSLKFQSAVGTPTYAVTPAFTEDIHNLRVNFILEREGSSSGTMDLGVMSDPLDPSTFELVQTIDPTNTDDFVEYTINLNNTTLSGGNNYIALRHNSSNNYWYYWLDDFTVELIPSCLEPTDLATTSFSSTTADISWTAGGSEEAWNISWGTPGYTPGDENEIGTDNTESASFQIPELTANTAYEVYVQADCGSGDLSAWAGPLAFTTLCGTVLPPYTMDFETSMTNTPDCWSISSSESNGWEFDDAPSYGNTYDDHTTGSGYFAFVDASSSYTPDATMTTGLVDVSELTTPMLQFYVYHYNNNTSATSVSNTITVEVYDGAAWNQVYFDDNGDVNAWEKVQIDLSSLEITADVQARYIVDATVGSNFYNDIGIDDVYFGEFPSCLEPTALLVDALSSTTSDISWTAGASEEAWNISWGTPGYTPGDENEIGTDNTESTSYQITELTAQTDYEVYVQADCGEEGTSIWNGPVAFTTACEAFGDFTEGFESYGTSVMPDCWSKNFITTTSSPYVYTSSSDTNTGSRALRLGNSGDSGAEVFAITPALTDLPNGTHRIKFFAKKSGTGTALEVGTMSDPTDVSTYTSVATIPVTTSHQEFTVNFTGTTDSYIAFKATYTSTYYAVSLDDIIWEEQPSCLEPADLATTDIGTTTADISWTAGASETAWNISWGTPGYTPGDANEIGTATSSSTTYQITELSAQTDYEFYVQADCGTTDGTSIWAGPLAFMTACNAIASIPYIENFDTYGTGSDAFPDCWTRPVTYTSGSVWPSIVSYGYGSSNSLKFRSAVGTPTYAVTPAFAEDIHNLRVSFMLEREGANSGTMDIGVMSDPLDPSTFELVQTIDPSNTDDFVAYTFNLNNTTLSGGNNYIALRHNSDASNWYYWLDDFTVELIPSCSEPTDLSNTAMTSTTADISWTAGDSETSWNVSWGTSGYTPGDAAEIGTDSPSSTSYQITGLTAQTAYDVYVQADCGSGDGQSTWAGPLAIFTGYCIPEGTNSSRYINNFSATGNGDDDIDNLASGFSTGGYGDFSSLPVSVERGGNIDFSVDIEGGTAGFRIWVDWNNDLIFDTTEEVAYQSSGYLANHSSSFTIPFVAQGNYRMRIVSHWLSLTGDVDPCTTGFAYGEFEDYTVEVVPISGFVYENDTWTPEDPAGVSTASDNVTVIEGTTNFTADIEMNNLTVITGATLNVGKAMSVNGDIINDGNITFRSDATSLGQIDDMTGVTVSGSGSITVERYIPVRDDGKGAYRYIASAVNSLGSIHDNWQEAAASAMANPNPGFGMFITGEGGISNGFDTTPANASSLFTFDNNTQAYTGVPNTNVNSLTAGQAFSAYVWGDRSVDILTSNDPVATSTTLRATGTLVSGSISASALSSVAGGFNLIGNPYQAILDMNSVLGSASNVGTNFYYVWDPNLGTRGAYATVDLAGTTTSPSESDANQYVMPGQAVWVTTQNAGAASLTFEESHKAVTADQTDVFRPTNTDLFSMELQLFQADRFANGQSLSDAVTINFSETGNNAVLSNDASKLSNLDENIGRTNGEALLSIENRAMPLDGEVLPLFTNQYRTTDYVFNAVIGNLPSDTKAYLMDNYLNIKTELANDQATVVSFSVNASDMASIAPDRFSIVFERGEMGVNDSTLTGLSIYPNPVKNGQFFIAAAGLSGEKVQVNLYNILGQKVYTSANTVKANEQVNVPTSSLEAGVYLVELNHNGKTFTGKVVVE